MIKIYCRHKHGNRQIKEQEPEDGICTECVELTVYSYNRLELCRYGTEKPVCSACKTHCYHPEMQKKIREVMRYSGPRMIFHHPVDAMLYLLRKKRGNV